MKSGPDDQMKMGAAIDFKPVGIRNRLVKNLVIVIVNELSVVGVAEIHRVAYPKPFPMDWLYCAHQEATLSSNKANFKVLVNPRALTAATMGAIMLGGSLVFGHERCNSDRQNPHPLLELFHPRSPKLNYWGRTDCHHPDCKANCCIGRDR